MRILVTGASGLLGVNLAMELAKTHTVFGTVNRHAVDPAKVPFQVIQCDLLKEGVVEQTLETSQPDWVIHCAALANVDACETDPELAVKLNTDLPRKLASIVARGGARQKSIRLVHISTDAVFDGVKGDYTEEDRPNPLGVYAKTKLSAEEEVLIENPEAVVARVNLFAWGITGKRSLAEFFFNHLQDNQQVMGFTDVFFCPILANDTAAILERMLRQGLKGLYHLVGSTCLSKYAFGVEVARQFGFDRQLIQPTSVAEAGLLAARSPNLSLRNDKLKNRLGIEIPGVNDGLEHMHRLYREKYPRFLRGLVRTTE
jgi:dTDP-4-dehydrorhamnose reductase